MEPDKIDQVAMLIWIATRPSVSAHDLAVLVDELISLLPQSENAAAISYRQHRQTPLRVQAFWPRPAE